MHLKWLGNKGQKTFSIGDKFGSNGRFLNKMMMYFVFAFDMIETLELYGCKRWRLSKLTKSD